MQGPRYSVKPRRRREGKLITEKDSNYLDPEK